MTHTLVNRLVRWAEEQHLACDVSIVGDIAIYSLDRLHRYVLTRQLGASERVLAGIGLNPSTATAFVNDPTIRRGQGFATSWGCGLYVMLNAYGYRATEPSDMWTARGRLDIVGEHNDAAITLVLQHLEGDDIALAAWGAGAQVSRAAVIATLAKHVGVTLQCLGTTKDGSPRHPLYVAAKTQVQRWTLPEAA